tara:strand:- start:1452 stop:2075 length:624 start_codon:yes stop_codon:yes gene_type:complete
MINVLSFGPEKFNTSLEELKDFFSFNLRLNSKSPKNELLQNFDILIVHEDIFKEHAGALNLIKKIDKIKIVILNPNSKPVEQFNSNLYLPLNIKDINGIIENLIAKKNFSKNSSIRIKEYMLNKNEKKLLRFNKFISLTEKEIQLLELLLTNKKSFHKDEILKKVWKYVKDVDTHTVETHIYRLRKKIKDKFFDEKFICNDKDGYFL